MITKLINSFIQLDEAFEKVIPMWDLMKVFVSLIILFNIGTIFGAIINAIIGPVNP